MTNEQTPGVGMQLVPQAAVYTTDGAHLGEVGETRPEHFKVIGPLFDAFWLRRDCVRESTAERVVVGFGEDELADYRLSDPGAAGVVPGGPHSRAYIPGATPEQASDLFDPNATSPADRT